MSKIFNERGFTENGQFSGGEAVTSGNLSFLAGGLYVGTIGDVEVVTADGSQFVLKNVAGFVPGIIKQVVTGSNTTASDIIALR
jgi:hypothetical protein